ncbi:S9 family peptidase [Phytoactinopolyspora halotolerans]|uniref:S9 family peptidase n=1 Tax=Phytoactinopolyspora halotolerans TaxID=1981512 RepID=A0A6L9SH92_9ACTN|nr:prolyl oligopeptidase family serine peptidase [Phytoactinopolyspora halotolerans]NEE03691.1 S9 family peptidase [Phytoactinopolyspora halotolerans]
MSETAPYGSWRSSIDADLVAEDHGRPAWVSVYGTQQPWWIQRMPAEGGRMALLRQGAEGAEVVLPAPWNVRSRVHEYGGRPYLLVPGEPEPIVVFSEFSDQRLYRFQPDVDVRPSPLTPEPERASGLRYVEPILGPGAREVWCIREELTGPHPTDVRRAIVAVPLDGSAASDAAGVRTVLADRHFLACPRRSPDGRWLSWIGWDHPSMPWDSTELRIAPIEDDGDGRPVAGAPARVAGGPDEAVVQAEWESSGDALLYVSDPSGWWNLHRVEIGADGKPDGPGVNLCPREEEFGGALWQLGMEWFVPAGAGTVAVIHGRASTRLSMLDTASGELLPVADDHTEWAPTLAARAGSVYGVAGGHDRPYQLMAVGTVARGAIALTDPAPVRVDDGHLPRPEARTFRADDGHEIHANLYPPRNDGFSASDGELPPYVVFVHGGPTSRAPMVHDLEVAYFTSRGIGVVEVNYGGSTGHGREYRNRLRQSWGVVDVEDSAAVARALVDEGLADPQRLAIRGGSAGGWTTAAALVFTDAFRCGVIMYPILDLAGWRTGETHDFESQYLESLVGPWPQVEQRYRERSPMSHPERVTAPFLLLQGLEDEICPPVQAERFVAAMSGRDVPHAYLTFDGEQHGFRKRETIVAAIQAELSLYAQVFDFAPTDNLPPLSLTDHHT